MFLPDAPKPRGYRFRPERRQPNGKGTIGQCVGCGESFTKTRSDHTTCSQRCQNVHNWATRSRVELVCVMCGTVFDRSHGGEKYCSEPCRLEGDRKRRRSGVGSGGTTKGLHLVPRQTCEICGAAFYVPPARLIRGHGRFCSRECHGTFVGTHPELFPQTKSRRGNGGKREDLDGLYVRSSWEANWARYLNWLQRLGEVSSWQFEPETFEFPVKRGARFYTPDFRVVRPDGSVEYHEVKGWMDQKSATKLKRMEKYHPHVKIILIDKETYRQVAVKVGGMIPYWERTRNQLVRSS
jgi:predicted nucleic acid-binding Zn ribbon protein